MRHHGKHPSVNGPQTCDTERTTVRIRRISLGRLEVVVHIADWDQTFGEKGLRCRGLGRCALEVSATFAMAEGDGHRGPLHFVQEDRGRLYVVEDLYLAVSCFVLLADILLEAGPCLGTGYERIETSEELAAVANAVRALALPFVDGY